MKLLSPVVPHPNCFTVIVPSVNPMSGTSEVGSPRERVGVGVGVGGGVENEGVGDAVVAFGLGATD
jgi:hypothetical protein